MSRALFGKGDLVGVSVTSRRTGTERQPKDSLQRALAAARTADENRGRDIVILDMRELTPIFDYFVIATGASRRQLYAISDEIDRVLEQEYDDRRLGVEGYSESRWVLLDYADVVVHLFDQETRDYYDLERLWCAAKRVLFEPAAANLAVRNPK